MHTDATYKLLWHACPVLIVGTTDGESRFFPFGLAVVSKERHFDFKFIFNSIQKGRVIIGLDPLSYNLPLMSDSAEAITNGFREAGFTDKRNVLVPCG